MMRKSALVAAAGLIFGLVLSGAGPRKPQAEAEYEVTLRGRPIGTYAVRVYRDGANFDAHTAMNVDARVLFKRVTIRQDGWETWTPDGRLMDMNSQTDRGDSQSMVQATRTSTGAYRISTDGVESSVKGLLQPTSFTFAAPMLDGRSRSIVLLDFLSGKQRQAEIEPKGTEAVTLAAGETVQAQVFDVINRDTGRPTHTLWLDSAGHAVRIKAATRYGVSTEIVRRRMTGQIG